MLARWDDFRTLEWISLLKYPEAMAQQAKQLLTVAFKLSIKLILNYFFEKDRSTLLKRVSWSDRAFSEVAGA